MEKILSISLKLNFTPNTLGCYRLKKACAKDEMIVFWMVKGESILSLFKWKKPILKKQDNTHKLSASFFKHTKRRLGTGLQAMKSWFGVVMTKQFCLERASDPAF